MLWRCYLPDIANMANPKFINGSIYHVCNRGVDKRTVFLADDDRYRFIHDLFEFNDKDSVPPINLALRKYSRQSLEMTSPKIENMVRKPRKLLVEILAFCLMNNHYHLLLRQLVDGGIPLFMRKLGIGYTYYFNLKYERSGSLFQGTFKGIEIESDRQLLYIPYYIHFNPLDFEMSEWRDKELSDYKKATDFLEKYRWSSHLDFLGVKNFPSVTQRELLLSMYGGEIGYKNSISQYLRDLDMETMKDMKLID